MKRRLAEHALAVAALAYLAAFLWLQKDGIGDPHALEWDARNMLLPAWRYHGTGLFPRDLTVDLMARFATPGWKTIYWLGTLFTDPPTLSRLVPFVGLVVVAWQGWRIGQREGGSALGAITVVALVHCTMIWNRMAGGHARAFAYPLVVAFLRYALERAHRRVLLVLLLEALCYPSALLFCLPAYALTATRAQWRSFGLVAFAALGIAALQSRADPRFGGAPTLAEARSIPQMSATGTQPFYPLPAWTSEVRACASIALRDDGDLWHGPVARWNDDHHLVLALLLVLGVVLAARRSIPRPLVALLAATVLVYLAARVLAYRLYLPDRVLVFGWPPLVLVALPLLLHRALRPRLGERAPLIAALGLALFVFGVCGDGLPRNDNITWFGEHDTATTQFLATLPREAVIATHAERATYVQTFAHRNVLFSSATNIPWFTGYEREMERRMDAFYRAYYAADPDALRDFGAQYGVDYLVADVRDFGPDAQKRARYYTPWGELARSLVASAPSFALATPQHVVFRDGPRFVVDLRAGAR